MAKLSGKIALITGGTGALGSVLAARMVTEGADVYVTHTDSKESLERLNALRTSFPGIHGIAADVTDEDSVRIFIQQILEKTKRIDILCHCVGGVSPKRTIEDITLSEWNGMMEINLLSCFLMMKYVIPSMKRNAFGRIITIAARAGVSAEAMRGGYGVSKAGVISLTKTAAEEMKDCGDVTVNAIAPGTIATEANKRWAKENEFNQWVSPEQIAEMVTYLCSELGGAMNGQIISMYGKV